MLQHCSPVILTAAAIGLNDSGTRACPVCTGLWEICNALCEVGWSANDNTAAGTQVANTGGTKKAKLPRYDVPDYEPPCGHLLAFIRHYGPDINTGTWLAPSATPLQF